MILSFRDKDTERFYLGGRVPRFRAIQQQAEKRLRILEAATSKQDLMLLPSNRFEALKGDRQGQYSVRINDRWRICFEWPDNAPGPSQVEITDYH